MPRKVKADPAHLAMVKSGFRDRKDKILSEAARLFAEQGFHQTRMEQVAARLGVSKVILYRYFASKEDLVSSILKQVLRRIFEEFNQGPQGRTLRVLNAVRENSDAYLMLLRHAPHDPDYGQYYDKLTDGFRATINREIMQSKHIANVSPQIVEVSIYMASIFGPRALVKWLEDGDQERDEEFVTWLAGSVQYFLDSEDVLRDRAQKTRAAELNPGKPKREQPSEVATK
jgi:AcrR family transcriptional regulator